MYELRLSAEQIEFRDTVRDFVKREVTPAALDPQRLQSRGSRLLHAQLRAASELGLRTLSLSEARGGAGADTLTSCIVLGELAIGDVDVATTLAYTSALAHVLFDSALTAEQRERTLPAFLSDSGYHLALAAPEFGVDTEWSYRELPSGAPVSPITAVRESGGDWILDGVHDAVANAPLAKLFVVQAEPRAAGSESAPPRTFILPVDTPGFTVRESQSSPVWFHGARGVLELRACRVPRENVIESAINIAALGDAPNGSLGLQYDAINLGVAYAAYEAALEHAKLRFQGGRYIIGHEGVGLLLAEMAVKLEAARNMLWHAAWAHDHPEAQADRTQPNLRSALLSRVFVSETAHEVAVKASEVFGAMGILRDMPLHKYVHDTRVFLHSGFGSTATKLSLAEALGDYQRAPVSARAQ